ncbi:hypothetical protein LJC17_05265, partial [Acholeplasma sp. OttesenSCG-928-E16]|nr:hypothetical protein [Acholeplasma sp. OttesenSCG-928-E16]
NNETNHRLLLDDEIVDAYLYFDSKGRVAATLSTPFITVSKKGFLRVKQVNENLGVFLDNNISKDVLLSEEDLPKSISLWPQVGDYLYVNLKIKGKMVAKRVLKSEIETPVQQLEVSKSYEAYVFKILADGLSLITKDLNLVFVFKHDLRKKYRLGEAVNVKITNYNGKTYNGTLIAQKEEQMHDDANHILAYLLKHEGVINLDSNSNPKDIEDELKLSKKAFKRGLGNLYKQRIIDFIDGKTILIKGNDKNEQ